MSMRKFTAVGVLALAGSLAACDDYLSGPGVSDDPNRPSAATMEQLYHGVQVNQFVWHTGNIPRVASLWMQQMSGTGRQHQNRDMYEVDDGDFDGSFSAVYAGGGLVDIREIQTRAEASGDRTYAGIAKVWEGFLVGMASSFWGDIPYSEAVGENATPPLDEQAAVYAQVQTVLDEAIADLQAGGTGPGELDLVYGGDAAKWAQAANTLKARFYMHWVEAQNNASTAALAQTACGGDCVAKAREAALKGISSPSNDMRTSHSGNPGEQNLWYQFMNINRVGDIAAGKNLVDLLKSRNDPRLAVYFSPTSSGEFIGAPPGTSITASNLGPDRGAPTFRQPMVTYAETQLILAETSYRQGDMGAALGYLNAARAAGGLPALTGVTGGALLEEIAIEKYIALFQNPEAWNDHKRLCAPALTPASGSQLPARLYYGQSEANVNPNIPAVGELTDRNDNDPNACS